MTRWIRRHLRFWVRSFWGTVVFCLVSLAVIVQLGRALFPVLNDYREQAEQQLSEQLGVEVRVGNIDAKWKGLRPRITLEDVQVNSLEGIEVFAVDSVSAEISLLGSLRDWRLGFRRVHFSHLRSTFVQQENGRWWVQGLQRPDETQPSPEDASQFSDPMDIFLFGRRVELSETQITLNFRSGLSTELAIPHIRLENDNDFHRLSASFLVDQDQQALHLVVEGKGNPRDESAFDSQGYLQLRRFPSEKVLAALGIGDERNTDDDAPNQWHEGGRVDMALWFRGTANKGLSWHGDVRVEGSPLSMPDGMLLPRFLTTDLKGAWQPQQGWNTYFSDLIFQWDDFSSPPLTLGLTGRFGEETELAIAQLDIGVWNNLILRSGILEGRGAGVLKTLQPSGQLLNARITRRSAEEGYFSLKANVLGAEVEPWLGVPMLKGVDGYVELSAWGGEIQLERREGFAMHFPDVYHQPLEFEQARGAVRWDVDLQKKWVGVSSTRLKLINPNVEADGYLNLRIPFGENAPDDPEMTLMIGAQKGAAELHRLLVPYTVPKPLLEWLDGAVKEGHIANIDFIYHGSLSGDPRTARVIQLRGSVSNGEVAFDPQWPSLQQASAHLYLDDHDFRVSDLTGHLDGVQVSDGQVDLVHFANGDTGVRVQIAVESKSEQVWEMLSKTPLKGLGGDEVSSWKIAGNVTGRVEALIPFSQTEEGYQRVALRFTDNSLLMPNLKLPFEKVNGNLFYDSSEGVSTQTRHIANALLQPEARSSKAKTQGNSIKASLWGLPVQVQLQTHNRAKGQELIASIKGQVDMTNARDWTARPELGFAEGIAAVAGELSIPFWPNEPIKLDLSSNLKGVVLDAPPPFAKSAEDVLPLTVQLTQFASTETQSSLIAYQVALASLVDIKAQTQEGRLLGVNVALGEVAAAPAKPAIVIQGQMNQADAALWQKTLLRYRDWIRASAAETALSSTDELMNSDSQNHTHNDASGLPIELRLQIAQMQIQDTTLMDMQITGSENQGTWHIQLVHPEIAGDVVWFSDDTPIRLQLSRLYLPSSDEDAESEFKADVSGLASAEIAEEEDFWSTLDLQSIPAADVDIHDLRVGNLALGRWVAKIRPTDMGLLAYDLTAQTVGLSIHGKDKAGAEVIWFRTPSGSNSTYFSGLIKGGNLAETFQQLDLPVVLTSGNAHFDVDLQWPDVPVRLKLADLSGIMDLSIERGVFRRGGGVGDNPLVKLIGLLNFDTLARRLRLDFSDLGAAGLGYESLHGSLIFRDGMVHIREPLQVNTPSSHLQLVGDVNIRNETIDSQLVATLPLTGNLTVAAALTGGVPLAIGVYVVGKLFKNQMDKVSSLRYGISGTWAEPEVKLEKIFENTVADDKRAGDERAP